MPQRLLQPLRFRNGRSAPNRLWLAPMTNQSSHPDGRLSDDELGFLRARAEGGFGTIETCATHVAVDGQGWTGELGIFADALEPDWTRLAEAVHGHDALLLAQTFHAGSKALREPGRALPLSSSPTRPDGDAVREASEADLAGVVADFAAAAQRAERAGADGVELHGAHGYLLCEFLSSELNTRTDAWGGALENRARLLRDALRATRAAVSDTFVVGVRLSPESYPGLPGIDLDESIEVATWLCADGADFVHISLWDAARNTHKYPEAHAARRFRDALPGDVPIVAAGAVWSVDDAHRLLDHGADAIALGRAAIANPAWPRRVVAEGEPARRPPLTHAELLERGLGPAFAGYMARWKGFVIEE